MTRILLVEDHEEIWDFLSRRLRRRGHEVLLAMDGEAAVEMARRERPDIVLLDMNLPVMDGWTAAGLIKAGAIAGIIAAAAPRARAAVSMVLRIFALRSVDPGRSRIRWADPSERPLSARC